MAEVSVRSSLDELRTQVLGRFAAVRRRIRTHFAAEGVARVCGLLVSLCAITLLLDWWIEISWTARLICWGVMASLTGWIVWRHLVRPFALALAPVDIAVLIDRHVSVSRRSLRVSRPCCN